MTISFDVIERGFCTFNKAKEHVAKANAQAIGGHTDWILADLGTAQSIFFLRGLKPEHTPLVWTSMPNLLNNGFNARDRVHEWLYYFAVGVVSENGRNFEHPVQLVRASQCVAIREMARRLQQADAVIKPMQSVDAQEPDESARPPACRPR